MKIGDIVKFKSGGPEMTITQIDTAADIAMCWWYSAGEDKFKEQGFPISCLLLVK